MLSSMDLTFHKATTSISGFFFFAFRPHLRDPRQLWYAGHDIEKLAILAPSSYWEASRVILIRAACLHRGLSSSTVASRPTKNDPVPGALRMTASRLSDYYRTLEGLGRLT